MPVQAVLGKFVGSHMQCVNVSSASPWKLQAIWLCSFLLQGCCHIRGDGKPGVGSAGDMRVAIFIAQVSKQIFFFFRQLTKFSLDVLYFFLAPFFILPHVSLFF